MYEKFLVLADKKKDVRDDDLLYLVGDTTGEKVQKHLKLKYLQILSGTLVPTATVIVEIGGMERTATSTGNGPIDAAVHTDTVRASVEAFVDALNLLGVTGKKEE